MLGDFFFYKTAFDDSDKLFFFQVEMYLRIKPFSKDKCYDVRC